ncbi:CehA/McbA family metallohydrolase [Sphingomonas nostoxanthinifaciens]|uniref:CehA/McbA family metallohydrolase n=1 Tax=Sphingomonas nostoxanthinifaciens TaxID=2872652 RepID=UPI001CC1FC78|nr:CehA/McbA family metallohydrolase [Sphingomonas nostoxanthinifaciens]UAK25938.1 CehA/McbA family metallohydrolase [Sphingomonas nostoxanthinifaciens]
MRSTSVRLLSLLATGAALAAPALAQWTHRYPKIAGMAHDVYLEGYELPTFSTSPTDPAPSPDDRFVAVAARGWLWLIDTRTGEARRLTSSGDVDSRPAWSPDSRQIAFVRDNDHDTRIMAIDVASGRERLLVDTPALDLDPAFSPDGKSLFYSSAAAGDLDLWRLDLASSATTRLTTIAGQELNPQPIDGGRALAFVQKSRTGDAIRTLSLVDGSLRTLRTAGLAPQLRIAAAPDGRSIAAVVPLGDKTQLLVMDAVSGEPIRLAPEIAYPLTPAWSRAGAIWFVHPDDRQDFRLDHVPATGGVAEELRPVSWSGNERTAHVTIRTREGGTLVPARLSVLDGAGHPGAPDSGLTHFDGQQGRVYFYTPGAVTLEVPAGTVHILASHGFDGAAEIARPVRAGEAVTINVDIPTTGFDAAARGWYSGDLHSHLNYGGPFQLKPDDLVLPMRAEALDVATPQLANLQTTFVDTDYWGWQRSTPPLIRFSQEVRSHFLGHVGVLAADAPYTPWYYGPGYPVYGQLDLANAAALRFARDHGGLNTYVHPTMTRDPFPAGGEPTGLPLELVPDAVLGDVDAIEVACLWSDELGSSEAWYRLLDLGLPITPTAGTDTMHNLHRMLAIGTTRVYAKPEGALSMASFLDALRKGRSFVSTGPMIEFSSDGKAPGEVVPQGHQAIDWTLDLWSPTAVEKAELLVNGKVVWQAPGLVAPGHKHYTGRITVPAGGWVAARVSGGASRWPTQDSYPFAHTAPVWLGHVGSTDPATARAAAGDLLRWMNVADRKLAEGYPGEAGASIKARFAEARRRLEAVAAGGTLGAK